MTLYWLQFYNSLTKENDDSLMQQFFTMRFVFVETYGNWSGIVVKLTVKNAHPILKGVYPSSCSQHPKVRGKVTQKIPFQSFLKIDLNFVYLSGEKNCFILTLSWSFFYR